MRDTLTTEELHELPGLDQLALVGWLLEHTGKGVYTRTIRLHEGWLDLENVVFDEHGHSIVTEEGDVLTKWVSVPSHRPPPVWPS